MSLVFLSHSQSDKPIVRRLAADLQAHHHLVWIDERDLRVGDWLETEIRRGLYDADFVVVLISAASLASAWVMRELEISVARESKGDLVAVLPVLLEEVAVPSSIEGRVYADLIDPMRYDRGLEVLLARLGSAIDLANLSGSAIRTLIAEPVKLLDVLIQKAKYEGRFHDAPPETFGSAGREIAPKLIECFGDSELWIRLNAEKTLTLIGRAAVPFLTHALGSSCTNTRLHAVLTLGHMGKAAREAVFALCARQSDHDQEVRRFAKDSLWRVMNLEYVPFGLQFDGL